jgi:hypothetical protein
VPTSHLRLSTSPTWGDGAGRYGAPEGAGQRRGAGGPYARREVRWPSDNQTARLTHVRRRADARTVGAAQEVVNLPQGWPRKNSCRPEDCKKPLARAPFGDWHSAVRLLLETVTPLRPVRHSWRRIWEKGRTCPRRERPRTRADDRRPARRWRTDRSFRAIEMLVREMDVQMDVEPGLA